MKINPKETDMAMTLAEQLQRVGMPGEQAKLIQEALAPVSSVNGKDGAVVLDASDVGAVEDDPSGLQLPVFSAEDLEGGTPDPTENAGRIVAVSDDDNVSYALAWSDGTDWLTLSAAGVAVADGS